MKEIINDDLIIKISKLAKLKIEEEEFETVKNRLSSVFEMLSCLKNINLDEVEPMYSACNASLELRKDIAEKKDAMIFDYLENNKSNHAKKLSYYTVHKIIE